MTIGRLRGPWPAVRGVVHACGLRHVDWLAELAADQDVAVSAPDPTLLRMPEEVLDALRSPDFEFEPLLPADDVPLAERVAALAAWCGGFLYGFGAGAPKPEALAGQATSASTCATSRTSRVPSSSPAATPRRARAISWSSSSSCARARSSPSTSWRRRGAMRRDEYAKRRRQLMRHMGKDAIAILPAAPVRMRNNDVEYHYRPDSDFYYLTGFDEPEAVAVLIPGRPQGEFVLFVRDRDPAREAWDGAARGPRRRGRATSAPTTLSRSPISTRSCRDCSSGARASSTPWARTRSSTSA